MNDSDDPLDLGEPISDEPSLEPAPRHPSLDCPHGRPVMLPYGLHKCLDCGSIEGFDRKWRHAEVLWPAS